MTNNYSEIARRALKAELCTLVVIDIQEKLLPPIFQREQLVRNSQLLIRAAGILKMPVLAPSWNSACTPEPADADGVKSAMAQLTPATEAVCSESARIPATELAGRCRADT